MSIQKMLKEVGFTTLLDDDYRSNIVLWGQAFKGNIPKFHEYTEYNGQRDVKRKRKTLGMAKKAAEDWADSIINPEMVITVTKDEWVDKTLERLKFRQRGNELVEKSFALGTGAFVEYTGVGAVASMNFIPAESIEPIQVMNGQIVGCAFTSVWEKDVTYLNIHKLEKDGTYTIYNFFLKKGKGKESYARVKVEGVEEKTKSPIAMFQIIKPAIVNNIDLNQSMGMSIYANAMDEIKAIDQAYTSLDTEIKSGKMRVYVQEGAIDVTLDDSGNPIKKFDSEQEEFYSIKGDTVFENGVLIKTDAPNLRIDAIDAALGRHLNLFGRKVGFGDNAYSFDKTSGYTNITEITTSNADFQRTREKHLTVVRDAIVGVIQGLYYAEHKSILTQDITVEFGDAIVQDQEAEENKAMREYNAGLISWERYLMKTEGLTLEQATARVKEERSLMGIKEEPEPEGV